MRIRGAGNKVDGNQKPIVEALIKVGATVQSLAPIGDGCVDLLVGFRWQNYLLEVKGEHGKLTKAEERWLKLWFGPWDIVRTPEEALKAIGAIK